MRWFWLALLWAVLTMPALAQVAPGGGISTVTDGTSTVKGPNTLQFSGATVSNPATGNATVTISSCTIAGAAGQVPYSNGSGGCSTSSSFTWTNGSGTLAVPTINATGTAGYQQDGTTILNQQNTPQGSLWVGAGAGAALPANSIYSTFVGWQAGHSFTGSSGEATCIGTIACQSLTIGNFDTALGEHAMGYETTGSSDTCIANDACRDMLGASGITAIGKQSYAAGFGGNSAALGFYALIGNSSAAIFAGSATNGDTITLNFTSPVTTSAAITITTGETLPQMVAAMATAVAANASLAGASVQTLTSNTLPNTLAFVYPGTGAVGTPLTFTASITGSATESVTISAGMSASSTDLIALGATAMLGLQITSASHDIAIGSASLASIITSTNTIGIGASAGGALTSGSNDTFTGAFSGQNATTASGITADGYNAFNSLTVATSGVAVGAGAGYTLTSNAGAVLVGTNAGYYATGQNNTVIGDAALRGASGGSTGGFNTVAGASAAQGLTNGFFNEVYGDNAANALSGGSYNLIFGYGAWSTGLTSGSDNIIMATGHTAYNPANASNTFALVGNSATPFISAAGTNAPTTETLTLHGSTIVIPDIANNTGAQTGTMCWASGGITYDSTNTCLVSSLRFKRDVVGVNDNRALHEVMAMRPVSFFYKGDTTNDPHFGLIAEDVARIDPALVANDNKGRPEKVKYIDAIAKLIAAIQAQQHEIDSLRKAAR